MIMTYEKFMTSPGENAAPDRKITIDIFDIAYMLTDVLRARGFLTPHEYISVYDLEPAMEACGYYLTIERKDGKTNIFWSAK